MPQLGLVRRPPPLGDHSAMPNEDQAVDPIGHGRVAGGIEGLDEGEEIDRRHPLGFRRTAGELRGNEGNRRDHEQHQRAEEPHEETTTGHGNNTSRRNESRPRRMAMAQ